MQQDSCDVSCILFSSPDPAYQKQNDASALTVLGLLLRLLVSDGQWQWPQNIPFNPKKCWVGEQVVQAADSPAQCEMCLCYLQDGNK